MHPSVAHILRFFAYDHLPPHLAAVSKPFCELAHALAGQIRGPEATAALRKLLEAKDCAVRAVVAGDVAAAVDRFYLLDEVSAEKFVTADGHRWPCDRELQTKGLDADLDDYYVFQNRLYVIRCGEKRAPARKAPRVDGGQLVWESVYTAAPLPLSWEGTLHAFCHLGKPVLTLQDGVGGDSVEEHWPWASWWVIFWEGTLTSVEASAAMQSRQQLREALLERGLDVLPDTDRLAQRHFALLDKAG